MRTLPFILVILLMASPQAAFSDAQSLYLCDGVYQSKACGSEQKAEELRSKPITKYQSPELVVPESEGASSQGSDVRASFNPNFNGASSLTQNSSEPNFSAQRFASLSELEAELRALRLEAPRISKNGGIGALSSKSSRLFNRIRSVCTTELLNESINNKRRCDQLKKGTADIAGEARIVR